MNEEMEKLVLDATKEMCQLKDELLHESILSEIDVKIFSNTKKLIIKPSQIENINKFLKFFNDNGVKLDNKSFVVDVQDYEDGYITTEQCKSMFDVRNEIRDVNCDLKIKDGILWDLEDVMAANAKLDNVIEQIKSANIKENGESRNLNQLEKFLWVYKFVSNRFYKDADDVYNPRSLTSVLNGEDIVCVGFANLLKEMCNRLNIECYKNNCYADGVAHANNVVIIDNVPYFCDACFDCKKYKDMNATLNYCLLPTQDIKSIMYTKFTNSNAPFLNIEHDIETFKEEYYKIQEMETMSFYEYNDFENEEYSIIGNNKKNNYFKLIPKYEGEEENYKDKALYYLKSTIKLLKARNNDKIISIDQMQDALTNVFKAQGKSKQEAIDMAELEANTTVANAHMIFDEKATNCFAAEPYEFKL